MFPNGIPFETKMIKVWRREVNVNRGRKIALKSFYLKFTDIRYRSFKNFTCFRELVFEFIGIGKPVKVFNKALDLFAFCIDDISWLKFNLWVNFSEKEKQKNAEGDSHFGNRLVAAKITFFEL
jgi:hypothetical protein